MTLPNKIYTKKFTLVFISIIILSISLIGSMIYVGYSSRSIAKKQPPQIRVIGLIKTEIITSHLWLEEVLSGDRNESIEAVNEHFEKANTYTKTLLYGGIVDKAQFIQVTNTDIRKKIQETKKVIDSLFQLTEERYLKLEHAKAGTEIDQIYDDVFRLFLKKVTIVENTLIKHQQKNLNNFIYTQRILTFSAILLGLLIIILFYWFENYKFQKEKKLTQLNNIIIENEERYRLLYQNAPLPYQSLNIDGYLIDVNPAWVNTLGYSHKETVGKHFTEFMTKESAELVKTRFPEFLATGAIYNAEFEMIKKDGTNLIVSYDGKVSNDEKGSFKQTHCVFSDVTEQKKAKEELIIAKEFSEKIIETSNAFIVGLDRNHLIQIFNEGAETITGYKKNEILGKDWFEIFFSKEIIPEMNAVWDNAWGKEAHSYENYIFTKTGEKKLISWQTTGMYEEIDINKHLLISIGEDITDRNAKQEALNTANKIINRSPVVAFRWKNEDGWPIEFVTNNVMNLTGINSEEFINNAFDYTSLIYKDDIKRVTEEVADASKDINLNSFTHKPYRIITENNKVKWVFDITFIIRDTEGEITHYEGIIYDITKEKMASEQTELFSRIFEESLNEIYLFDAETLLFTQVNSAAQRNLGYTMKELKKMTPIHLKPLLKTESFKKIIEPLEKNKTNKIIFETIHQRKDKSTYNAEVHLQVLKYNEKSLFVALISDITERKKYENHLEELVTDRTKDLENSEDALLNIVDDLNSKTKELKNINKKLASVNAEMETFTYSVSHDLKAPLRGIDGYSKLLLDLYKNDLNEEAQEFLMNVRSGTQQMNELIDDLLAYSRLERQDFQFSKIKLKPIIDDILQLLSNEINKTNLKISINCTSDFTIVADSKGLKLVLRNLLDNAIKFTNHKDNPHIEITSVENSTHWLIFVKDNGVGFDMKYHDRIFKIFQRLHLPEEFEGTGIGLAMVEKAMHRMNGKIWAESKPNEGSCFYLEIKK